MLCSSSEGFCLEELRGSILFNAGPLIVAVGGEDGLLVMSKSFLAVGCLFARGYFGAQLIGGSETLNT